MRRGIHPRPTSNGMKFNFKNLEASDVSAKKVLLRLDLNVPIAGGKVLDDYRITRSLRTIKFLEKQGAKTLIVSHIERDGTDSLKIVAEYLKKIIAVDFVSTISEARKKMAELKSGNFILLENIRQFPGETANDKSFAKELASLSEMYVNEAFSVSHRNHASIVGVPKFLPSVAGFLFADEIFHLSKAFNPDRPFIFLLAGAKFDTKFPLAEKFLKLADKVFIGGALANDLFKAKGYEIGRSKHSETDFGFTEILHNPKLILPEDVVTENAGKKVTKKATEVIPNDGIFDAGERTVTMLANKFVSSKFILWNGTLGDYEKGFSQGTEALAKAITESGVESIVGGGDTLACISKLNILDKFSFVSTGGGAMLEFLANETLPGIDALNKTFSV